MVTDETLVVAESGETTDEPGLRDHLEDIADGSGCTEIWERLETKRQNERD